MAKDVLEWGKWLAIVIKKKPIKTAESKFDPVEAILKGNAFTHWQEFKRIKIARIPKIQIEQTAWLQAFVWKPTRCAWVF
eukprot:10137409-Ditylum_brightwellii.AAC.1